MCASLLHRYGLLLMMGRFYEPRSGRRNLLEELLRVVPASISLMSVESTFSNPFGKLEAYTIPENLDHIEEGNWSEEESEQLSLFEV